MSLKNIPNLIIGGVHKSGTTSLFNYLSDHPDICGSKKKEIHYYTPMIYNKPIPELKNYFQFFNHHKSEKYLLEASPSYLYGNELLINQLFKDLPNVKMIFILRNPVDRFTSYYNHCVSKYIIDKDIDLISFFEYSKHEINNVKDHPFHRALKEGCYSKYLTNWLEKGDQKIKLIFFDELKDNPKQTLISICNWLKIDESFYGNYTFNAENKTIYSKNALLYKISATLNMKLSYHFRKMPQVKQKLKRIYYKLNGVKGYKTISAVEYEKISSYYSLEKMELLKLLKNFNITNIPSWLIHERK
jgi:hypothetical protein